MQEYVSLGPASRELVESVRNEPIEEMLVHCRKENQPDEAEYYTCLLPRNWSIPEVQVNYKQGENKMKEVSSPKNYLQRLFVKPILYIHIFIMLYDFISGLSTKLDTSVEELESIEWR